MTEDQVTSQDAIEVNVNWVGGEQVPILYASNAFIRVEGITFLVSLAQAHGPYDVHPNLEKLSATGIDGRIVARFAIPADRWKAILDAANRNYTRWADANEAPALDVVREYRDAS
jgi:hypothetical protein